MCLVNCFAVFCCVLLFVFYCALAVFHYMFLLCFLLRKLSIKSELEKRSQKFVYFLKDIERKVILR